MRILERIFVGSIVTTINVLLTAVLGIIIYQYAGRLSYWYWWVVGGLIMLGIVLYYIIYQGYDKFPYTQFRVPKHPQAGKTLHAWIEPFHGDNIGEAWKFETNQENDGYAIYGPWLEQPLRKGKYKATFRMKIHNVSVVNHPIVDIDVACATRWDGDTRLACRTLTTSNFAKADEYDEFSLYFKVDNEARKVEFRVWTHKAGSEGRDIVILDYVQLSRQLF